MAKKRTRDFQRIQLHLALGDTARLKKYYPDQELTGLIRTIIRKHIAHLDALYAKAFDKETERDQ
jgi:hypothetical protein